MKKKMFLIAMAIVVPFLLFCVVLGGLVGGNTEVVPADEETAMKYQMCGSQLGVDWSWVMLIDMYMVDQEHTDITSQNMVYTALNYLKVTIEVYEEEEDEDGETHWEYDHTDYAYGADAIMEYFGLSKECRDVQQVVRTIQGKNSSQFHISTAPYDNLKDVLDTYYGCFDEETKTEMLTLNEQKYLVELYEDIIGEWSGTGSGDGLFGDYEIGDLVYPETGMEIPLYYQYQQPWGDVKFGGNTIRTSGCSVTSIAMVFSYLRDSTITPPDIVAWTGNRYYVGDTGQSWDIFPATAKHWGIKCYGLGTSLQGMIAELAAGHPVIASMRPGTFTQAGHFIVLRGITEDGRILVNDPNDNATKRFFYTSFAPALIQRESKQYWSFSN